METNGTARAMENGLPKVGDQVSTPRFLTVEVEEVFGSESEMWNAGYREPTHARHPDYVVGGKVIDGYTMMFAVAPRTKGMF